MLRSIWETVRKVNTIRFNGHPPLGVDATCVGDADCGGGAGFNGHPPLGVDATVANGQRPQKQQRCFNGHPPLGVDATQK